MNYCKQCGQKHEASACPLAPSNWPGNVSMTPESFDAAIQAGKAQGRAEALSEAAKMLEKRAGYVAPFMAHELMGQVQAIRALTSPPPDTAHAEVCLECWGSRRILHKDTGDVVSEEPCPKCKPISAITHVAKEEG